DPGLIAKGPANAAGGWEVASSLLASADPPTALFCFNDQMAMGAYRAIAECGLRIPQDISVVGFDDQVLIAPWLVPSLTTMALPHYAMGRWAVEFLVGHGEGAPQHRVACPRVDRDSVAPPPLAARASTL
ncbi:MAG: substrate-binding domain-containing protein, partial [Thermoanaerobaculales bacterium]